MSRSLLGHWWLALFLLAALPFYAQQPQQAPAEGKQSEEMPVFRSDVALVKVDVKVSGSNGQNRGDLDQEDFIILDEGQPQKISHFGRESEPLNLLLVLDVSGSMWTSLKEMTGRTSAALRLLHTGDQVAVMLFAQRNEVIQPFTTELGSIQYRIISSIYKQTLGRGTLINESLIAAAQYMRKQAAEGRRAILMVTDNEGVREAASEEDVVRAMHDADTTLNAIVVREGIRPEKPGPYQDPNSNTPDVFKLAERTGGEAAAGERIAEIFPKMVERIRTRYSLHYPAPAGEPGGFRHIRVELSPSGKRKHPDAIILAREGYNLPR